MCIAIGILLLGGLGCRSASTRVGSLIDEGLYEQALEVLEEEGAGVIPTADVEEGGLDARALYETALRETFTSEAEELDREGKLRTALLAAQRGADLCPWSAPLCATRDTLASRVAELDELEGKWSHWPPETGQTSVREARSLLGELRPVALSLEDSPRLQELQAAARDRVVQAWARILKSQGGVLTGDQAPFMEDELAGLPGIGDALGDLHDQVARFAQLRSSTLPSSSSPETLLRHLRQLALDSSDEAGGTDLVNPLHPCINAFGEELTEWTVQQLPELVDSPQVDFPSLCIAEDIVQAFDENPAIREAIAAGHLRRAEILGRGGVASLLAWTHLERAADCGLPRSDERWSQAAQTIRAALQATDWPSISIGIDFAPSVDPSLQGLTRMALRQAIVHRGQGWSRWRWVEPRVESPDVLLVIDSARCVATELSALNLVSSSYFSHHQQVPNPSLVGLELSLSFAKSAMNSAKSSYDYAVTSHNYNPTTWSLQSANNAYNNYVMRLNAYNNVVAQYNATPATISQKTYLPYSFREGTVRFGWKMTVQLQVGTETQTIPAESISSDFARIGTRRADRSASRRTDDPIAIDTSVEAGLMHLNRVATSACTKLDLMLGSLRYEAYTQLTEQESEALAWLLHPWGPRSDVRTSSRQPGWLREASGSFKLEPTFRSPTKVLLASSTDVPPAASTAAALARWYEPVLCEVRAADKDGFLSHGSGVLISGDGLVLTCEHVLGGPFLTIKIHEGEWSGEYEVEPLFVNEARDVAILRAKGLQTTRWAPVRLSQAASRGEQIIAMGNPSVDGRATSYGAVAAGIVSNPRVEMLDSEILIADVSIASGSSGGPLISVEDGAVIGIVQMVSRAGLPVETGTNVASSGYSCLAAPARSLTEWLGLVHKN